MFWLRVKKLQYSDDLNNELVWFSDYEHVGVHVRAELRDTIYTTYIDRVSYGHFWSVLQVLAHTKQTEQTIAPFCGIRYLHRSYLAP